MENNRDLEYGFGLLDDIAEGLRNIDSERIGLVEVTFCKDNGEEFVFSLVDALLCIAQDLVWDERGYWGKANRATVRLI